MCSRYSSHLDTLFEYDFKKIKNEDNLEDLKKKIRKMKTT